MRNVSYGFYIPSLCLYVMQLFPLIPFVLIGSADTKQGAHRDETPPRTPTGNAPSSESDIDVSSPSNELVSSSNDLVVSQEEDERLAKELSLKEAAAHDLSHRPKRRRFHESYNFNMKCPTPGCNSLGEGTNCNVFHWIRGPTPLHQPWAPSLFLLSFSSRSPHRETWETFLHIGMPPLPQSLCWWMQGTHNTSTRYINRDLQVRRECETMIPTGSSDHFMSCLLS